MKVFHQDFARCRRFTLPTRERWFFIGSAFATGICLLVALFARAVE